MSTPGTLSLHASKDRYLEKEQLLVANTKQENDDTSQTHFEDSTCTPRSGDAPTEGKGEHLIHEPSRGRLVVTMVACLFVHMSSLGMSVPLGVIYVEFITYFESPRSKAALVQSLFHGFCMGGGLLFTRIFTKYDSGYIVVATSGVAAVCFCTSALAQTIDVVIVLIGALSGLAASINYVGGFVITSWMFQKHRKLALAVLTVGSTVGQTVLPFVTRALIERYAWQGTLIVLGSVIFLNCIPCGLVIHFSKGYFRKNENVQANTPETSATSRLTNIAFVVFLTARIVFSATLSVESWFVVDLSVVKGFTADAGATLLSLNGALSFIGRCLGALIFKCSPAVRQELHLAYIGIVWGICHVIVSQSPEYWGMVLGMIIRGLCNGLYAAFLPGLLVDLRGLGKFPQTLAISNFISGLAAMIGGPLGGLTFDLTGSYDLIFFIATGCALLYASANVVIFFLLKLRRKKENYENL